MFTNKVNQRNKKHKIHADPIVNKSLNSDR